MFDKDADYMGMSCEDVLFDLSKNAVYMKELVNFDRFATICFRFWNENMKNKIKTSRNSIYDDRFGFHTKSYNTRGPYGGSKSVPLRNFYSFSKYYRDTENKPCASIYAAFPDKDGKLSNTPMDIFRYDSIWMNTFSVTFSKTHQIFSTETYFGEHNVRIIEPDEIYFLD